MKLIASDAARAGGSTLTITVAPTLAWTVRPPCSEAAPARVVLSFEHEGGKAGRKSQWSSRLTAFM
ncbi:hypothetical protein [Sorangium sp. So ce1153]|uniref:hypothetical protein n=1 Tax=Sorangium sp. So ce1153 TaxID=3133333 RepID=UPI003F5DACDF